MEVFTFSQGVTEDDGATGFRNHLLLDISYNATRIFRCFLLIFLIILKIMKMFGCLP